MRIETLVSEEDGYTQVFVYRGDGGEPVVVVYAHPAPEAPGEWWLRSYLDGNGWDRGPQAPSRVQAGRDEVVGLATVEAVKQYWRS